LRNREAISQSRKKKFTNLIQVDFTESPAGFSYNFCMSNGSILPVAASASQTSQGAAQASSSPDVTELLKNFKAVLSLMVIEQTLSSLGSSASSSDPIAGMLGGNTGALGTSLSEQLLSQQIQNAFLNAAGTTIGSDADPVAANVLGSRAAASFHHINQFTAELQVGGDGRNADCGPASLVMALHQLGVSVAGETSGISDGKSIDLARLSMAASSAKDGLDSRGLRSDAEHSTYTNFSELTRGATAAGAKSNLVQASASSIQTALQHGASVIVSGTFTGKSPLPWTGDRGIDNATAPGHAGAHFVEVSSYDAATGLFTINDPARAQAHQVTASTLDYFMSGNAGALALSK
jgi:hypothetical protein